MIKGVRADAGHGDWEGELDEGGAAAESAVVDPGERGGKGELDEAFATDKSESADVCVGDGGEVDNGEGGAIEERAVTNGDDGRGECEGGEGGAARKGPVANAGERSGQRELGERDA